MITILLVIIAILLAIGALALLWCSFNALVGRDPSYQPNDWATMLYIAVGLAGVATFILGSLLQ